MKTKHLIIITVGLLGAGMTSAFQGYQPKGVGPTFSGFAPSEQTGIMGNKNRIMQLNNLISTNENEITRLEGQRKDKSLGQDVRTEAKQKIKELKNQNKEYRKEIKQLEKEIKS